MLTIYFSLKSFPRVAEEHCKTRLLSLWQTNKRMGTLPVSYCAITLWSQSGASLLSLSNLARNVPTCKYVNTEHKKYTLFPFKYQTPVSSVTFILVHIGIQPYHVTGWWMGITKKEAPDWLLTHSHPLLHKSVYLSISHSLFLFSLSHTHFLFLFACSHQNKV